MIAEAIDTLCTLGWALLAWIVLMSATVTLALWTVAVTVVWACVTAWRGVSGAVRLAQRLRAPEPLPVPERAARAHTEPHVPSWAHTDKDTA